MARANEEMRHDIDEILETARDAIIVVAGDHGPYLTGDCAERRPGRSSEVTGDELVDRYGLLPAVR